MTHTETPADRDLLAALEYVLPIIREMETRIKRAPTETPWGIVAARAVEAAIAKAAGGAA